MYELWYGPKGSRRHVKRETMEEIDIEQGYLEEMGLDEDLVVKET